MPFFVIKKGLVLLEWKYFPTPKILDPFFCYQKGPSTFGMEILSNTKNSRPVKWRGSAGCPSFPQYKSCD